MASLIALLGAGTTPWRREWDAPGGGHHVNLLSGRSYRGTNPDLLTLGMPLWESALPYRCGFSESQGVRIAPRKGSKAVHVLRPQLHQQGESQLLEAGGKEGAVAGGSGEAGASGDGASAGRCWVSNSPWLCSMPPNWMEKTRQG